MRNSTQYKLAKPRTFRRSSSKILPEKNKKHIGWGGNLQNIEKSLRSIYISDGLKRELESKCKFWLETGDLSVFTEEELEALRVFLQCDQSGAEALIVAYDCRPADYRKLFIYGVKPHVYVALKLFPHIWRERAKREALVCDVDLLLDTPIENLRQTAGWLDLDRLIKDSDNWSLQERYYYLAKQTVHSSNYDIQAPKFRMNILEKSGGKIVISQNDGVRFLQVYRGLFPEIPERNNRVRSQVDQFKVIYNMFGFPLQIINENITETTYKEFYAWGPQSTVGEITRTAFCDLQEFIEQEKKRWDILADTHDSYLVQCPLMDIRECREKMQQFMNIELTSPVDGVKFRMKSEVNIGFNWGPFKKDNELGLREPKWLFN